MNNRAIRVNNRINKKSLLKGNGLIKSIRYHSRLFDSVNYPNDFEKFNLQSTVRYSITPVYLNSFTDRKLKNLLIIEITLFYFPHN